MKHFNELYEKYYNAYKNDHDTNELSEAKKKKFDCKQFELLDKTDKKLTLKKKKKKKMTSLITYWVLLTEFINFLSINFAEWTTRWIKFTKMGKSK